MPTRKTNEPAKLSDDFMREEERAISRFDERQAAEAAMRQRRAATERAIQRRAVTNARSTQAQAAAQHATAGGHARALHTQRQLLNAPTLSATKTNSAIISGGGVLVAWYKG